MYGESIGAIYHYIWLLNLVILEGDSQGHSDFEGLYLVKEPSWAMCYH